MLNCDILCLPVVVAVTSDIWICDHLPDQCCVWCRHLR